MKEKILLLITKCLDNITHENIFYTNHRYLRKPIVESVHTVKHTYINNKFFKTNKTYIDILSFHLTFEDGEPNIEVGTNMARTDYVHSEHVSKSGFFAKKIVTDTQDHQHIYKTYVSVGHVKIELTDEEAQDLMDATKKAYDRYLELKQAFDDEQVMQKLDLRLNS